jgi:hypothetical protein
MVENKTFTRLGHEIEFKYLDKNEWTVLVLNKNLSRFSNFKMLRWWDVVSVRRNSHFQRDLGENVLEKYHLLLPISGSLAQLFIPICSLF